MKCLGETILRFYGGDLAGFTGECWLWLGYGYVVLQIKKKEEQK